MDKLEYIPRDLVSVYVGIKKYIVEVIGTENENEALLYQIKFPNGEIQYADKDNIVPIPLTHEILEKNGWEKKAMSRGIKNSHLVYTKPDIEEYGYVPIYIEKVSVKSLMYIRLLTTMYVHKLYTLSMFMNSSTFSSVYDLTQKWRCRYAKECYTIR